MESPAVDERFRAAVLRKVLLRLIPFLFLLYVLNILNRTNVGFARLKMLDELSLSEEVFGMGASIFFIGYFLFQVPSNLLLNHLGARMWIAGIVIVWGLVSSCMMFISGKWSFYLLRFGLGLAQAGFFPGMILYLTYWIPSRERAKATAFFITASAVSGIIGSPLSGAIMQRWENAGNLAGWQWMFLLEGLPTVLLGIVVVFWLTERPEKANWLTAKERDWLHDQMRREQQQREKQYGITMRSVLRNPRLWLLCLLYFSLAMSVSNLVFYLPQLVSERFSDVNKTTLGMLVAIPYLLSVVCMIPCSVHSDRTGERRWHVAVPSFVAAIGFGIAGVSESSWLVLAALSIAAAGMYCTLAPFWSLPNSFLSGTAAAAGIGLINSVGNLGGFVGPNVFSGIKEATNSFRGGLLAMTLTLLVGAVLAICVRHDRNWEDA